VQQPRIVHSSGHGANVPEQRVVHREPFARIQTMAGELCMPAPFELAAAQLETQQLVVNDVGQSTARVR
jgi:hypothetical protein